MLSGAGGFGQKLNADEKYYGQQHRARLDNARVRIRTDFPNRAASYQEFFQLEEPVPNFV